MSMTFLLHIDIIRTPDHPDMHSCLVVNGVAICYFPSAREAETFGPSIRDMLQNVAGEAGNCNN
jgi:hypothetical protein